MMHVFSSKRRACLTLLLLLISGGCAKGVDTNRPANPFFMEIFLADCPGNDLRHAYPDSEQLMRECLLIEGCQAVNVQGWIKGNFTTVTCSVETLFAIRSNRSGDVNPTMTAEEAAAFVASLSDTELFNAAPWLRLRTLAAAPGDGDGAGEQSREDTPWFHQSTMKTFPKTTTNTFELVKFQARNQPLARQHQAAAVLGNTVFVFGGIGVGGLIPEHDVFFYMDTLTRQWTSALTPPELKSRASLGMTGLVDDGRPPALLLFGGYTYDADTRQLVFLNDTWLYRDSQWTDMTNLLCPPPSFGFSLVSFEAEALLFGGYVESSAPSTTAQVAGTRSSKDLWMFSYKTGSWTNITSTTAGASPPARGFHVAAMDQAGYMFIFGGESDNQPLSDLWMLTPGATRAWTALQQCGTAPIMALQGVLAAFGSVADKSAALYLITADTSGSDVQSRASRYDVEGKVWAPAFRDNDWDAALTPTFATVGVTVGDDIITIGGAVWLSGQANYVYAYNHVSETIGQIAGSNMDGIVVPPPRVAGSACAIGNDVLTYGGAGDTSTAGFNDIWKLSADFNFTQIHPTGEAPHLQSHSMVCFGRSFFVFGGANAEGTSNALYRFDLDTNQFAEVNVGPRRPQHRMRAAAALSPDGLLYIHGGFSVVNSEIMPLGDLWVINLAEKEPTWLLMPVRAGVRPPNLHSHDAAIVKRPDGKPMLTLYGGQKESGEVSDELWLMNLTDAIPQWELLQTKLPGPGPRSLLSAVGIGTKLLIIGGSDDTTVWEFDRFHPQGPSWIQHGQPYHPNFGDSAAITPQTAAGTVALRQDGILVVSTGFDKHIPKPQGQRLDSEVNLVSAAFTFAPDCPAGYAAARGFEQSSCLPCKQGHFTERGDINLQCTRCPDGTTTAGEAASSFLQCNQCQRGYCKHGGRCTVKSDGVKVEALCECRGLWGGARCQFAGTLAGTVVGVTLAVLIIVVLVYVARAKRAHKRFNLSTNTQIGHLRTELKEASEKKQRYQKIVEQIDIHPNELSEIESIGTGGFNHVFSATLRFREKVALRMMKREKWDGEQLSDEEVTERFVKEYKRFLELPRHVNLVKFKGTGFLHGDPTKPFIALEYANRGDLKSFKMMQPEKCLPEALAVHLWVQLTDAVAYLHRCLWVHKDIKPANILVHVNSAGFTSLMLIDFDGAEQMRVCPRTLRREAAARFKCAGPHRDRTSDSLSSVSTPLLSSASHDSSSTSSARLLSCVRPSSYQATASSGGCFAHASHLTTESLRVVEEFYKTTVVQADDAFTVPYCSPERLLFRKDSGTELDWYMVDIYSIGITMCELVSTQHDLFPARCAGGSSVAFGNELANGLRPAMPATCSQTYRSLVQRCWNTEPSQRLTAEELHQEMKRLAKGLARHQPQQPQHPPRHSGRSEA